MQAHLIEMLRAHLWRERGKGAGREYEGDYNGEASGGCLDVNIKKYKSIKDNAHWSISVCESSHLSVCVCVCNCVSVRTCLCVCARKTRAVCGGLKKPAAYREAKRERENERARAHDWGLRTRRDVCVCIGPD